MTRVVGIDPSLTSTGLAFAVVGVEITTKAIKSGATSMALADRGGRLRKLTDKVSFAVQGFGPDVVLIESPAPNQKSGSHHDRSGYWWFIVSNLIDLGYPVYEIPIQTIKKYATGSGNANKEAVVIAATRRYPEVEFATNDEADALILAALGCRLLGDPFEGSLPKPNMDALKNVPKLEVPVG